MRGRGVSSLLNPLGKKKRVRMDERLRGSNGFRREKPPTPTAHPLEPGEITRLNYQRLRRNSNADSLNTRDGEEKGRKKRFSPRTFALKGPGERGTRWITISKVRGRQNKQDRWKKTWTARPHRIEKKKIGEGTQKNLVFKPP